MALFREWTNDNDSLAAIWKIDEPEEFFIERTGVTVDIKHDKRRLEHLAGRFLLKHLEEEFPLFHIHRDEQDKPRVSDDQYYFSISHSWPYAAVIISEDEEVGIDLETWHPRIHDIQHKFLSDDEQEICKDNRELITLAWSAKEAAYKWAGKRGIDFKEHLPITFLEKRGEFYNITILYKMKLPNIMISLEGIINSDFCCAYVVSAQDWAIY